MLFTKRNQQKDGFTVFNTILKLLINLSSFNLNNLCKYLKYISLLVLFKLNNNMLIISRIILSNYIK